MFDAHPPFQIDGNFGGTSGIAEMLLQSHRRRGRRHTGGRHDGNSPPAGASWRVAAGQVTGLRARGGFDVDLSWRDGHLATAHLTSRRGGGLRLRRGDVVKTLQTRAGRSYTFTGDALR